MQYRIFGRTGLKVSEIGFGCWGIGGGWGSRDDEEAKRALLRAFELGINFYDTALGYGNGHSEELLGEVFSKVRDKVIIATKIPPKTYRWPVLPTEPVTETFPKDWVIKCNEESLRHLKTDYIDIQQLHAWTDAYNEQLDWYEGLMKLREQGKVRYFGVSSNDWDPYGPVNLIKSGRIDSVQVIYNIFEQRPEEQLLPSALEHNVGIIVRVPFEEGLLTGKITPDYKFEENDWRARWLIPERIREAYERVEKLKGFLSEDIPDLPTLALKFVLSHPAVSTVIPGMRKVAHVENNVRASDGKLLPAEILKELKKFAFVHGWKYPWSQE